MLCALIGLGLMSALTSPTYADGRHIFRYRDAQGVLQIVSVLPPDQAQAGYEILDATTLRVLAVVARAPTHEERAKQRTLQHREEAARHVERQVEQARQDEAAERRQRDRMLLETYASEADLLALRDAKLDALRLIENSVGNNISALRVNLARMDATIAEHRGAGRVPPPKLQAARAQTLADLTEQQQAAERLQTDRAAMRERFNDDLRRYRELTSTR